MKNKIPHRPGCRCGCCTKIYSQSNLGFKFRLNDCPLTTTHYHSSPRLVKSNSSWLSSSNLNKLKYDSKRISFDPINIEMYQNDTFEWSNYSTGIRRTRTRKCLNSSLFRFVWSSIVTSIMIIIISIVLGLFVLIGACSPSTNIISTQSSPLNETRPNTNGLFVSSSSDDKLAIQFSAPVSTSLAKTLSSTQINKPSDRNSPSPTTIRQSEQSTVAHHPLPSIKENFREKLHYVNDEGNKVDDKNDRNHNGNNPLLSERSLSSLPDVAHHYDNDNQQNEMDLSLINMNHHQQQPKLLIINNNHHENKNMTTELWSNDQTFIDYNGTKHNRLNEQLNNRKRLSLEQEHSTIMKHSNRTETSFSLNNRVRRKRRSGDRQFIDENDGDQDETQEELLFKIKSILLRNWLIMNQRQQTRLGRTKWDLRPRMATKIDENRYLEWPMNYYYYLLLYKDFYNKNHSMINNLFDMKNYHPTGVLDMEKTSSIEKKSHFYRPTQSQTVKNGNNRQFMKAKDPTTSQSSYYYPSSSASVNSGYYQNRNQNLLNTKTNIDKEQSYQQKQQGNRQTLNGIEDVLNQDQSIQSIISSDRSLASSPSSSRYSTNGRNRNRYRNRNKNKNRQRQQQSKSSTIEKEWQTKYKTWKPVDAQNQRKLNSDDDQRLSSTLSPLTNDVTSSRTQSSRRQPLMSGDKNRSTNRKAVYGHPKVRSLRHLIGVDTLTGGGRLSSNGADDGQGKLYDVPQIECPSSENGMDRFACPSRDDFGRYLCIDDQHICDGYYDCPHGEDEERVSCMFYKSTKAHLDVLADYLLQWARGQQNM